MQHSHHFLSKQKVIFVLISGLLSSVTNAQSIGPNLEITATGSQEATQSILTPTKVLQGDELLNKLGWKPQVQLDQGLKNAYAQMLEQPEFSAS